MTTHRDAISVATCLGRVHRSLELAKKSLREMRKSHETEHHIVQAEMALSECVKRLERLASLMTGRDPP